MTVLTRAQSQPFFGLRPMNPLKDLRGVANLIEESFANTLDGPGRSAIEEMRWLNRLKPFLWWTFYFSFERNDFLSGFVWEEDGQIVGNVTINPMEFGSRRWVISNLAVSQAYRKRGIATSLINASMEMVKQYNGSAILLQVRADNDSAKRLYHALEFKDISGVTNLKSKQVPKMETFSLPSGLALREHSFNSKDVFQVYQLAKAATPMSAQQEWPVRQSHFWLDEQEQFLRWLGRLIGGIQTGWLIEDGKQLAGMVNVQRGFWGEVHFIEMIVHPNWRGYLERPLLGLALRFLYRWRNNDIQIRHPVDHAEAITLYKEVGFQEEQTLLWMKRKM